MSFADRQLYSFRQRPGAAPDLGVCLVVTKVAPKSVAAKCGILPGDYLVSRDGVPASDLNHAPTKDSTYIFYSPANSMSSRLEATSFPLGLATEMTHEAALATAMNSDSWDTQDSFYRLWELGDWDGLLAAGRRQRASFNESLGLLSIGAALFELGEAEEGKDLVLEFINEHAHYYTLNFHGMGYYYLALYLEVIGDREGAIRMMKNALDCDLSERAQALYYEWTGEKVVPTPAFLGKTPRNYELKNLKKRFSKRSMKDVVNSMKPGQLWNICLLAVYRVNGPYLDFTRQWMGLVNAAPEVYRCLHVITHSKKRNAHSNNERFQEGEIELIAAQKPVAILSDPEASVSNSNTNSSPWILTLDHTGKVVSESTFDEITIWEVLVKSGIA